MPRLRRSSPADDFTAALSKLPWWACVIVALVSYLVLHAIAAKPLPQAVVTAGRINLPAPSKEPHLQDKRTVVPLERGDWEQWLRGTVDEAAQLVRVPPVEIYEAGPASVLPR